MSSLDTASAPPKPRKSEAKPKAKRKSKPIPQVVGALPPPLIKANLEHRAKAALVPSVGELQRKRDNERGLGARAPPILSGEAKRRARLEREATPAAELAKSYRVPRVIPWLEWCKLRGISLSTGERLQRTGKVKVTYLSERRKGVREDHDREYLESCTVSGE
jgi:hypothetical protein